MSVLMFKDVEEGSEGCWFPPERCQSLLADEWRFTKEKELTEQAEDTVAPETDLTLTALRGIVKGLGFKGHGRSDRQTLEKIFLGQKNDNQG